jgi:D-3-phosphoglycerate dehydrogenase
VSRGGGAVGPFRVVVTDHGFPNLDGERSILEPLGATVVEAPGDGGEAFRASLTDADALLVQFASIDAATLASLERCRVIVRYGIGVDSIDLAAATRLGIPVVNVPDYALDEVADHALALLLALARKLPQAAAGVRAGAWGLGPLRPLRSLAGRTLGLAGFGAIARRVALRAQAFGMRVQAYDPYVDADAMSERGVAPVDWEALLATSDALSLHLPLTDETHHLFDAEAFAAMTPGALLVNTSRGAVVRTPDLVAALDSGAVAGAALDVLEVEPPRADEPLLAHPNAIVTAHCAWYTEEALDRLKRLAAEEVARALRGERPKHVVNPEALAP